MSSGGSLVIETSVAYRIIWSRRHSSCYVLYVLQLHTWSAHVPPPLWHFDDSHVAQKCLSDGKLRVLQPFSTRNLFISLSFDLIIPVSGRTLLLPLLSSFLLYQTPTTPPPHQPIASILALNRPWYSTVPVCSDTEGGRRAVTAQSLVALWLGAAECAMVH